ncbi:MAG: DUF1858 domain-containing protein [Defluviitaleaceae bacterium]|nr:DUF1858 domain-containing protein [Defluviitaleaceae bacterium]
MQRINKEMLITDALEMDMGLADVLGKHGMGCLGCPGSRGKTLEMAASGHGVDIDVLIDEMNAFIAAKA